MSIGICNNYLALQQIKTQLKSTEKTVDIKFEIFYKKVLTTHTILCIMNSVDAEIREHSSAGRASALQAEGHRFDPYCSHTALIWPGSSVG